MKKIIHIDMDCFYAAVEMRDNPTLIGKPVAVGGRADQRGVLATCNYEARRFGLHSAMPTALALRKCPHLILLPGNMSLYRQISQQIHQIFQCYTSIIEPLSLDEAYLDVSDSEQYQGSATWIAEAIRQEIYQTVNLTASAGVAPLKFLAKVASDINKPNGCYTITPDQVESFVRNLSLTKIPGVGKVASSKLSQLGLSTCHDVQQYDYKTLITHFGKLGERIWQFSHGIDPREVQPHRIRKSVSVEQTLTHDIVELSQAFIWVELNYAKLLKRYQQAFGTTSISQVEKIGVKLKFNDFNTTTLERHYTGIDIQYFQHLFESIWQRRQGRSIRLLGMTIYAPEKQKIQQLSLCYD